MKYGVTFKGINSNSYGLTVQSSNRQALSDVSRVTKQVIGYAGDFDFGLDTYQERTLIVILQYNYHHSPPMMAVMAENIIAWLYNDGNYYNLIFDDSPGRVYHAKCVTHVDVTQGSSLGTMTVTFNVNPPWPFGLDNSPISPADASQRLLWDNAINGGTEYMIDLTADGPMRFTVGGDQPVKPIITLLGYIPAGLTLTYGTQVWKYLQTIQYDGVVIDCNQQTVEKASDSTNLFPTVDPDNDAFFTLQPGQNEIDISGSGGPWPDDLTVIVAFTPIYG
jgi:predicted phage tail component-like protein